MLVLGSQMHWLTMTFLVMELMLFSVQLYYYYAWPYDKRRLWYLVLLSLLIFYNLAGGLFPDPQISRISLHLQNAIAYGAGFLMAAYFPYYFYRAFSLESLRWHALYGAPLLLLLPFLIFFGLIYPLLGNLDWVIRYGLIVPFLYSPVLLFAILNAIRKGFRAGDKLVSPYRRLQMRAVYAAVSPWVGMTVFSYFRITQWLEVLLTNTGFIIITVLFILRSGRFDRMEMRRLRKTDEQSRRQLADFSMKCRRFELTGRETEVAKLLCRGMSYKRIAEHLFIAGKTVDNHVQHIFLKTGVRGKTELQKLLGPASKAKDG